MSRHLRSQQFAEALIGAAEHAQHLRECPACNAELIGLRNVLGNFRHATHNWSEKEQALAQPLPRESRVPAFALPASIVLLAIAGIYYSRQTTPPNPDDAILLNRVHAGVSRSVPDKLEPLMAPLYR